MGGWTPTYIIGLDPMGNKVAFPIMLPPGVVLGGNTTVSVQAPLDPNSTNATDINEMAGELQNLAGLHQTLLTNSRLIATGTGDNTSGNLPVTTQKKPWIDPPEGSVPYDQGNTGTVALGAVGTTVQFTTFTVPQGYDGVINAFSWNFTGGGFVQGSGDLQAQILRNGVPIRNYDNILQEKGTIGIPRPIAPIRIYSNDVITLQVNHVANNLLTGNLIGSFVGYFYPSAS